MFLSHFNQRDLPNTNSMLQSLEGGQIENEQLRIDGLEPFTFYNITVEAVGVPRFVSPASDVIRERTNSTVPPVIVLPMDDNNQEPTANSITISLPFANFSTGNLK